LSGALARKVAIVTGASRGIGRGVAVGFGRAGAAVVAAAPASEELEAVAMQIRAEGGQAAAVATDVSLEADVYRLARTALDVFGGIDILVNNAGVLYLRSLENTPLDVWNTVIGVNLTGAYLCCRAVVSIMRAAGGGSIINVSSNAGRAGFVDEAAYCASKWGLEGLTQALALELKPAGIAVNSVVPGVATAPTGPEGRYDEATLAEARDPLDIAPGLVYLARQPASALTGQMLDAWVLAQQAGEGGAA
jgi:NAD(P)-dependent dehydrogenase (short-subunit alcohol dehydrogenase family)